MATLDTDTKKWIKGYRTEISASTASLLSTISAVRKGSLLQRIMNSSADTEGVVPVRFCEDTHASVRLLSLLPPWTYSSIPNLDLGTSLRALRIAFSTRTGPRVLMDSGEVMPVDSCFYKLG